MTSTTAVRPVSAQLAAHVAACLVCRGPNACEVGRRLELAAQLEAIGWGALAKVYAS